MDRADLLRLARAGAVARLAEIEQERQAIFREFPDLRRARAATDGAVEAERAAGGRRKRAGMSAAQRKAVSERMRKYWAGRRGGSAAATAPTERAAKKTARTGRAKSEGRKGARKMSASARKRISAAQKARWAEWRKKKGAAT
jgi:hypothetical protein